MPSKKVIRDTHAVIDELAKAQGIPRPMRDFAIARNRAVLSSDINSRLFTRAPATVKNLFTGVKMTGLSKGLALAGIAVAAAGSTVAGLEQNRVDRVKGKGQDIGYISGMSQDASGNVSKGRRDLGATGDLVFGLHNMRRG